MSSFYRQHDGRPHPQPARNRSGYHPPPVESSLNVDPAYLAYLQSQATHLNNQIAALAHNPTSVLQPTTYTPPSQHQSQPVRISRSSSNCPCTHPSTRQNPAREGSKWWFYAVKNGTNGDGVYSSWQQAYPYYYNPATEYFFPSCICKGFDHYEAVWDFLLGLTPNQLQHTSHHTPPEPPNLQPTDTNDIPPTEQPHENEDTESMNTYDYNTILPSEHQYIPTKVHIDKNDTSISFGTNSATPFLTAASDKALPKYGGRPTEDVNEFIHKLRIFLNHPSIDNCHRDTTTTDHNKTKSKHLAALLSMCLSGTALSPFIDSPRFDNKGIEMLTHLMDIKHPVSLSSATTTYHALGNQHIRPDESFDSFAKHLRLMYETCTRSGIPYDEGFLIHCFINGLDSNFDQTRELLDCVVLQWYELTLHDVLIQVTDIKLNKISTGTWITDNANANATGKQGAKRPTSPKQTAPSNTITVDPDLPSYLYKPSELTFKEVWQLLVQCFCPLCCRNTHPLHKCNAVKNTYNVTLQSTNHQTHPSQQQSRSPTPVPSVTANQVSSTLPLTLVNEPERYAGYEGVQPSSPALTDDTHNVDLTDSLTEPLRTSKLNEQSIPYLFSNTNLKKCMGSIKQCSLTLPYTACYHTSFSKNNEYPVIIDSGATHHMWNNPTSFISYKPMTNCYVSLANNYCLPIKGSGTIQLLITGCLLQIHNIYFVPSLQHCLYSVKQH